MLGAGESTTPAVAVAGGCVWIARAAAGAVLTVNAVLTSLLKPEALAVSCLPVPAVSIRKSEKAAEPLPPALPMFKADVPCNGPDPLVRLRFTLRLAGRPTAELLPN